MSVVRIHQLAKELGVANKVVLEKAKALGIEGKVSHSSSLTDEETEALRRHFIRDALGSTPDKEQIRTQVDGATGEQRTVLESRKGNVIRRRKASDDDTTSSTVVTSREPVQVQAIDPVEPVEAQEVTEVEPVEETVEVVLATEQEEISAEAVIVAAEPIEEVVVESAPAPELVAAKVEIVKPEIGPRVLGRIELDIPKPKPAYTGGHSGSGPGSANRQQQQKPREGLRALTMRQPMGVFGDDSEDDSKGKKSGKKVKS
jgi:translation initiation factor IF-2